MALTRKLLKGMGLTDEQVDTIIEAHTDVVDGLKDEIEKNKGSAARLTEVEKELNDLKAKGDDGYKDKYEKEHSDFEAYKAEIAEKETQAQKADIFRKLLEKANISKAHIETLIDTKTAEKLISGIEIKDGKAVDEDKISKAKSDEFKKFSSDYEKLYKDLGISKSIESDEDDEMHETITFLPKRALQKMILEMLFDEHFSINEDGKFADLMGDDSDSKEDNKDASRKADSNSEGNSEGNSGNKSDDKKDGGSNGSNAPSGNASGNDLYVIPMPGLKFPDDNEE